MSCKGPIFELPPHEGAVFDARTLGPIILSWEEFVGRHKKGTQFAFHFISVEHFEVDCTPALRKFARKFDIRRVTITDTNADACRKILTTTAGFFNLESLHLQNSVPTEPELTLPLALRKTTTSTTCVCLKNVDISFEVLKEWTSLSSKGSCLKELHLIDVSFDEESRAAKALGQILGNLPLQEFSFEPSSSAFGKVALKFLGRSIASIGTLRSLSLSGIAFTDNKAIDALFSRKSRARRTIEELSLVDCSVGRDVVSKLTTSPFPQLRMLVLMQNKDIGKQDIRALENLYHTVETDIVESDSGEDSSSASEDDEDEDDFHWDMTQQPNFH